MKKTVCVLLAALIIVFAAASLTSCSSSVARAGVGIVSEIGATENATQQKSRYTEITCTAAAVVITDKNVVTHLAIDALEASVEFGADGVGKVGNYKTKGELKEEYGMKGASPVGLEWYEQRDAFVKCAEGKTVEQIKALAANGGKPGEELVKAGCTVNVGDFIAAVEKAVKSAVATSSPDSDKLTLKISTESKVKNATDTADGGITLAIAALAQASADGEPSAKVSASVSPEIAFSKSGENKTDKKQSLAEKVEDMLNMGGE